MPFRVSRQVAISSERRSSEPAGVKRNHTDLHIMIYILVLCLLCCFSSRRGPRPRFLVPRCTAWSSLLSPLRLLRPCHRRCSRPSVWRPLKNTASFPPIFRNLDGAFVVYISLASRLSVKRFGTAFPSDFLSDLLSVFVGDCFTDSLDAVRGR